MKRRAFLGNFGKLSVAAASAATLAGAVAARPDPAYTTRTRDSEGIFKRLARMEKLQKRLIKVTFILIALTLGLDLSLLL
ncbi:MAG TPA: hypothetical protein VJN91_04900 [Gammaproteobacteria bacterium]|nr:hypothetical protein [Gammaproteobacteria bacterium]